MSKSADKVLLFVLVALIAAAVVGGILDAVQNGSEESQHLLAKGALAPAFSAIRHADKQPVKSEDLKGKVVVLDFWGTWCPPCRAEAPVVRNLANAYASQGVVVLAMNSDGAGNGTESPEEVQQFLDEAKLADYPVVYPQRGALVDFKVEAFPTLYVIGRDGKVTFRDVGAVPERKLREAIDAALKG